MKDLEPLAPKPHIGILHYTAPPIVGGVEQVIAQHVRLFVESGYRVTVLTGRGGADETLAGANVRLIPQLDSEQPANLEIARQLERGVLPQAFAEFQIQIEGLLMRALLDVDLVIVHNVFNYHFNMPLTAALHALIDRGAIPRMIAWCHDISRYVNPRSGTQLRFGFPWDLLRTYRREVDYVAVSPCRQQLLLETLGGSESVRVVPNGVSPDILYGLSATGAHLVEEFGLDKARLILLMPVRVTRAKNIEYALQVTAALKAMGAGPKLVVVGPPDPHDPQSIAYFNHLLDLRDVLNLKADAVFIYEGTSKIHEGTLSHSVVAELYRISDLVLLPSHREGFAIPVLEAGLLGKSTFTTRVPVLEMLGTEDVHLIEPGEPASQVAARIQVWSEQDTAFRLRRRVRQEFTWSAIFAREIECLISDGVGTLRDPA